MVRFYRSTVSTVSESDVVIIGVSDESKSLATRKGTSRAPDIIRAASNESEFFKRAGKIIPISPMAGKVETKKIIDFGNVKREDLYQFIYGLVSDKKIPIMIGGDHSITSLALKAISDAFGKTGLLYFDAHPDFVSTTRNYYGSVLTDSMSSIDFEKSMLIGTRAAEPEELENARSVGLEVVTPLDLVEMGVLTLGKRVTSKANGKKKYVSIDLDCLDPAFAPAVSVPSPGGISSIDLIYLVKQAVSTGIIGMDIVELSPDFDINNITSHLAARILFESIASLSH
jgi:agmatinase